MTDVEPSGNISKIAAIGGGIAAIAISLPVIGVIGIRVGLLAPMAGFTLFGAGAVLGGALSLLLGLVGVGVTRGGGDPDGRKLALAAVFAGVALFGAVAIGGSPGAGLPPINDITTDLDDPPQFQGDPSGRGRDMAYPEDWKPLVRAAYADLQPHAVDAAPSRVFEQAIAAAERLGWTITRRDAQTSTIEASDTTAIFQFVDDVVIRIRPSAGGSVLDIRSKSRDGQGDVGANAARIRALLSKL